MKNKIKSAAGFFLSTFLILAMGVGLMLPQFSSAQSTTTSTTTDSNNSTSTSTATTTDNGNNNNGTTTATTTDNGSNGTTTATSTDNGSNGTSTPTTTPPVMSTTTVMVMKHLCDPSVQNETDLLDGATSSLDQFVRAHTLCRTTALPGHDAPSGSITGDRTWFSFNIMSMMGTTSATSTMVDSMYMPSTLCETAVNRDFDGDNLILSDDCLDSSFYEFNLNNLDASSSLVMVKEVDPPMGYHFGSVMFTPDDVSSNNDDQSLVSVSSESNGQGTITLDTADDDDNMIMLHVFNFADTGTTTPPGNGTTTPPNGNGTTTPPGGNGTTTPPGNGTSTPTTTPPIIPGDITNNVRDVIVFTIGRIQDIQVQLINFLSNMIGQ